MKQIKIWAAGVSALSLLLASACSNGNDTPSSTPGGQAAASNAPAASQTPAAPATIKYFFSDNNAPLPDGNLNDKPWIKFVEQKTNTDLDVEALAHSTYEQTLKLKFASGDKPDLLRVTSMSFADLQANDQLLALNDLIDKYGPNLKKVIPKEAWDAVTIDGKIFAIPSGSGANAPSSYVTYVRKDWLDKVGGKIPATSDELLDLFRLFRDKDPNGNGKKDEIPFSMREKLSFWYNIAGMWGISLNTYHLNNGEVIPSIIHPNMKNALAYLKTMYDEKLLDQEFLTQTAQSWQNKLYSGLTGSVDHLTSSVGIFNDNLAKNLPGTNAELIAIPTPLGKGYTGPVGGPFKWSNDYYFVTKSAKNPEAIIKMLDWYATEEGSIFASYGLEGDTFTMNGDKIKYDQAKDIANKSGFRLVTGGFASNFYNIPAKLERTPEQERNFKAQQAAEAISRKEGVVDVGDGLPTPQSVTKYPDINPRGGSLFLEAASKIILGKEPIDYFDKFVADYRAQGGNELIKEMTDAYKKKNPTK